MTKRSQWLIRFAVAVVAGSLVITAAIVGAAPQAWRVLNAHDEVPVRLGGLGGLSARSVILDKDGAQIGVFEAENIQPVDIAKLPEHVPAAFRAVEDEGFESHRGVNLRALVRAAFANFNSSGGRQGASTITQQVVKLEFLGGLPRDGRYKVLQSRYAAMLEKTMTKDQIMERYLERVFFGNNAYGIEAAAEVYFGKRAAALTLPEAGFLAGLVRAPSTYDPVRRPQQAKRRFREVTNRLVDAGLATRDAADAWLAPEGPATFAIPERLNETADRPTSRTYISEMVRDFLLNQSTVLGASYAERYDALYRGGINVVTTIDKDAQAAAEKAAKDQLPTNAAGIESSLVSLDTDTGAIRALRGGSGFVPGRNEVNLALRRRQTGSSIKMFVLLAALEAGAQASDLIDGTLPCVMPNPEQPEEPFKITKGVSNPTASLAEQTWLSINCAYARLAQIVGLQRVVNGIYEWSKSTWLTPETFPILPYASLSTGANELSAMDMASGAQTIANEGVHHEPWLVAKVTTADGRVLYERKVENDVVEVTTDGVPTSRIVQPAVDKAVADQAVDILKQTLIRGTARRTPLANGRPSAGKTGTQDNNTNAWFVGFTRQLTTAVWVGDPDAYTPMNFRTVPEFRAAFAKKKLTGQSTVTGSTFPAWIWQDFMNQAHDDAMKSDFEGRPTDWDAPPAPVRNPLRLYLPGKDCIAEVVSGRLPQRSTGTWTTVVPTVPPTTVATTVPPVTVPPVTVPPVTTVPGGVPPVVVTTTVPKGPTVRVVDPGTTIPRTVSDPKVPVIGVDPATRLVYDCARGVPSWARIVP